MTTPGVPEPSPIDRVAIPAGSWIGQLSHWLRHPAAPAWVLAVGAALLLLGSQWPQLRAPWPTADGLSRADLQALATTGGAAWSRSLAVHAWLAVAIGVAIAHCRRDPVAARPALLHQLTVACALVCGAAWLVVDGGAVDPLWLDVPIVTAVASPDLPPAEAWRNDHGALVGAGGPFRGRCTPVGTADMRCQVVGPGLTFQTTVGVQAVGTADNAGVHWMATLPASADTWNWQPPTPQGRPLTIPLRPGQTVAVPDWGQRRVVPVATTVAGPLVVSVGQGGGRLWAAPRLVGHGGDAEGTPLAHLRGGARARLLVAGPTASLPVWLVALGFGLVSVWLGLRRRSAL